MGKKAPVGMFLLDFEGDDVIFRDHDGKESARWTEKDRVALGGVLASMAWNAKSDSLDIVVGGACPVQGEGKLDGLPIYFRARHDGWSFAICQKKHDDAVNVAWGDSPGWWTECDYGSSFDAGWMSGDHSRLCVMAAIRSWRAVGGIEAPLGQFITTDVPDGPQEAT